LSLEQPIRPAATVIVVREAEPQYEIFMLRRTHQAAFAGGMYVFPGGRVDTDDHAARYSGLHIPTDKNQQSQRQALGTDWRGYWVAGIRETFEEAGFLLAYDADGRIFEITPENQARFATYRQRLHDSEISLAEICEREHLRLAIDLIHFYNRWITPEGRPRRFDTRFFITALPGSQTGLHDGSETVDSCWISPNEALRRYDLDEFGLMRVTQKQLLDFAQYRTADDFLTMARNNRKFPTYQPSIPS